MEIIINKVNTPSIEYKESELTDEVLAKLIELSKDWEKENSCHGYRANTKDDIEDNRIFLCESEGEIIAYLFGNVHSSEKAQLCRKAPGFLRSKRYMYVRSLGQKV